MSSNGESGAGTDGVGTYQRILVGTDGSRTAEHAVDRAVAVSQVHGARLTILSAGRKGDEVLAAEVERRRDAGIEIDVRAVSGDPAHALVAEAREGDYDLLVVGNKGLSGIRRMNPLGSVPGKISHHLPCALLVVKTT